MANDDNVHYALTTRPEGGFLVLIADRRRAAETMVLDIALTPAEMRDLAAELVVSAAAIERAAGDAAAVDIAAHQVVAGVASRLPS